MAVEGLNEFIEFFNDYSDSFVIIGGLAVSEWLSEGNLTARLTKDIDIVVLAEAKERGFFPRFWEYIRKAGYSKKRRSDGKKLGFRFVEPNAGYPAMIELLARPELVEIPHDIAGTIVPLNPGDGLSSLSAILLDEPYYQLIIDNRSNSRSGLPMVKPEALLLLKAKAYLNLIADKKAGKVVRERDIKKHRNDVFHLAYLLDEHVSMSLNPTIMGDLIAFLSLFPAESPEWDGIHASLSEMDADFLTAEQIHKTIRVFFGGDK